MRKEILFMVLMAVALGVAWSFPFTAQAAKKPTVLVINTTPGQWGLCCASFAAAKNKGIYFDALFKHLGYTNGVDFKEVQDVNDFDKELFSGKWDIFVVSYHGWRDSPALQGWIKKKDKELEQWFKNAHGVVSTGGRDAEDVPLAKLLGFGEALVAAVAADKCCIKMIPNTPLSKGMAEKLDTSKSGDPSLFGDGQAYDKGKLPKGAEVAAVSLQDDKNVAITYGRFGTGGYVLAAAEITNLDMGFGQPEMSKDSFTLWQNIVDWFGSGGLSVEPSGKLPTSWGRIKAEY
jgi:hypothetical protein